MGEYRSVTLFLVAKLLMDGGATVAFVFGGKWPLALMFLGFTIADAGTLCLA